AVSGDGIAGGRIRAPNQGSRDAANTNSRERIAQRVASAAVGSDEIALDNRVERAGSPQVDAAVEVRRDDIARTGLRSADERVDRPINHDAIELISDGNLAAE